MKKSLIISLIILVLAVIAVIRFWSPEDTWLCRDGVWVKHGNPEQKEPTTACGNSQSINNSLSESEARIIAEKSCIKGGEALSAGTYNENSKTWWFDANLNATRAGCNPTCVVDEETKMAEINWRCTGLKEPVACTMEAKLCPDGSYVGRTGPNCEFVCP
jgi:hypothetical protein